MRFLLMALLAILLVSCNNDKDDRPDVSRIAMDVQVARFDRDFFSLDTNQLSSGLDTLLNRYPRFLPVYFEYLSPINYMVQQQGRPYSDAVKEYVRNIKPLYDSAQKAFPDLNEIEKDLETYLKYVKHYFPSFRTPAVFTTVESLNPENKEEIWGTLYFRDTLVISLQMFLGQDFSAYDPTLYFDYIRRRFEPEFIVPNSMRAIANTLYTGEEHVRLIEIMIEKGKQWWLLDKFLPGSHDSLKTGFTGRQLEWCSKHEGDIWGSILQNTPDLYTQDLSRIQNYIGESPRTMDMPEESPGNIGQWVGWQIVKKYAEKNGTKTIPQILATPAVQIFQEAKYKPK